MRSRSRSADKNRNRQNYSGPGLPGDIFAYRSFANELDDKASDTLIDAIDLYVNEDVFESLNRKLLAGATLWDLPTGEWEVHGSFVEALASDLTALPVDITVYRVERTRNIDTGGYTYKSGTKYVSATVNRNFARMYLADKRGYSIIKYNVPKGTHCIAVPKFLGRNEYELIFYDVNWENVEILK